MFNDVLIMAGGSGTRLWPASSSRLPKQFLPAEKGMSFFSMAIERALSVTDKNGQVIIIAGLSHIPHVLECAANFSAEEKKRLVCIGEPIAKNTAPAIACAVKFSLLSGKKGEPSFRNMLVLTSDHVIKPLKTFKKDASIAAAATRNNSNSGLFVFGIPPKTPDTGFGYIEIQTASHSPLPTPYSPVLAFHEKPDAKTAEKYLENFHAKGNFFWNSGMFAFNCGYMAELFRNFAPAVFTPFDKLNVPKSSGYSVSKGVRVLKTWQGLGNAYKNAKSISFDYAIAEKCPKKMMVKTNFNWIDIGNWEEYARFRSETQKNNSSAVFNALEDGKTDTNYVDSDIPVALAGVEDLIVVIRSGKDGNPASALITKKGQTQKVKDAVELIKKAGKTEIL